MASVNNVLNWFKAREGKVTYSMSSRMGPRSYDCSSSVYFALIEAGFLPQGTWPGNTESLYQLEGRLLQPISRAEVRAGDIFVAGPKGNSLGANGHTGVFLDNQTIIHCTIAPAYGVNGITTTPAQGWMGGPPVHYYRLKGATESSNTNNNAQKPTETKPTIKEEKLMYIYWKQNSVKKDQFDGFFVNGNKRMHMPNTTVLNECRTLVKEWGFNTFEPKYSHDNFRVATIEKTTDLVKW